MSYHQRASVPTTERIKKWHSPKDPEDVRSFMGILNNYRRYVKGFTLSPQSVTQMKKRDHSTRRWNAQWHLQNYNKSYVLHQYLPIQTSAIVMRPSSWMLIRQERLSEASYLRYSDMGSSILKASVAALCPNRSAITLRLGKKCCSWHFALNITGKTIEVRSSDMDSSTPYLLKAVLKC